MTPLFSFARFNGTGKDGIAVPAAWAVMTMLCLGGCFAAKDDVARLTFDVRGLQAEMKSERDAQLKLRDMMSREIEAREASLRSLGVALEKIDKFASSRAAENFIQLDQLIQTVQDLRGRIEETEHNLTLANEDIQKLRSELEGVRIEGVPAKEEEKTAEAEGQPEGGVKTAEADAKTEPVEKPKEKEKAGEKGKEKEKEKAKAAAGTETKTAAKVEEPPKEQPSVALFKKAFGLFKEDKLGEARIAFKEFITKWPADPLADNAQFWIAESYYIEKKYPNAAIEFKKVREKFPKGDKVPNALFKLGLCLTALKMNDEAKAAYRELVRGYPKSPLAKKAEKKFEELDKETDSKKKRSK